ncbi:NAD-glutamate dehydrogenase [Hydrocarboniphaga sp.]|uniref:NAD-glutamate dehydrogenase n=1 Tax=Hydrocarboniphaga sp. TaxID=2033016 RepID=UPI003D1355C4
MNDPRSETLSRPAVTASEAQDSGKEQESLLAQLEGASQNRADAPPHSAGFIRAFYDTSSIDALRLRSEDELLALAFNQLRWTQGRQTGELKLRLLRPGESADALAGLALVETCVDDMPYLVDTVAIAVREAGVSIDWAVHPILKLRRDAGGQIVAIGDAAAADAGAGLESWIHMEFEPLPNEAAYAALEQELNDSLADLRRAVGDAPAMVERALALAEGLAQTPPNADPAEFAEGRAFLQWLADGHFTFLGYTETRAATGADGRQQLFNASEAALGLSRPGERYADTAELIAPKEELDKYAESPRLIVVTKANRRAHVHLADYMDVISVKQYREDGSVAGTCRFVGLFASDVYVDRPRTIPLIRKKADYVMRRSRIGEDTHSGKLLREILHLLPRDELFQSSEQELYRTAMGIRALRDRHQLKLFLRRDRYGRFYSCLIYLPRDRYSRELRDRLAGELLKIFNATAVDRQVDSLRGSMARVRFIVRTPPGTQIDLSAEQIEQKLIAATRNWREQLRELLQRTVGGRSTQILARYADAFPLSYTESVSPSDAEADLHYLLRLSEAEPLLPRLIMDATATPVRATSLKLYARQSQVALSDVLPTLENFGLRVLSQEPTQITPKDGPALWIQEFSIEAPESRLSAEQQKTYFEAALLKTFTGATENDGLNKLVLASGLDYRQVACVRALAKYINQVGLPFGRVDIEHQLGTHPDIARLLVRLFESRFDPRMEAARRRSDEIRFAQEIDAALDAVTSLDADRVLRAFLSVVHASLRTNFYQSAADGSQKPYISIKLDPSKIPELPFPRPMFEIWVYSPEVEGVHLRGGRVARGGLRWSDRREDFRTEVLGLMKAQMVKNAVIVPVGAKGGFVVKKPVDASNREAWMAQGISCYQTFLRGLLDITDNRVGDAIQAPRDVVRLDEDDPYLVVAADKGTATFSDIANGIAHDYGFWLGDAFASGGSVGYDHKKMGITAKGAWESVKRHFRELDRDIQSEPFTVIGIGDMSGDVFGNGMLLSRKTRVVAAFDHRHIFIDPNPDEEKSFNERERLFALPRSSWMDYDASLISEGGGIYPRTAKLIKLSPQAQSVLGIASAALTPPELMNAILKAPVDLFWNGGIGTYVKSQHQSHAEVRDRANDNIRVNGRDLRVKVVGEGGNLGFTQAGRIEYALNGGRLNTDAIDNSAGVHCSDREVNIKIPLNRLMAEGQLTREQRDPLLAAMTDDVARLVLRDNYVQSACVSLMEREAATRLDEHAGLMRQLERDGLLNRVIEVLPDEETLKERRGEGRGLTRPELAVLVAYSKISLNDAALMSDIPDDPFFERDLLANFPPLLVERYRSDLLAHRLKREIIATILSNAIVNRMGIAFAHRMAADHGVLRAEVLKAYATAHEIFRGDHYWRGIEALDNQVPAPLQYRLMQRATGLLKHATGWLVRSRLSERAVSDLIACYREPVAQLEASLPSILSPAYREEWDRSYNAIVADKVDEPLAHSLANTLVLGCALDIADLAEQAAMPLAETAAVYFAVGERLRMPWLHSAILALKVSDQWQALARNNLRDDAYKIHRRITARVLTQEGANAEARIDAWTAAHEREVRFAMNRVAELQASNGADFQALAVAVREVRKLRAL